MLDACDVDGELFVVVEGYLEDGVGLGGGVGLGACGGDEDDAVVVVLRDIVDAGDSLDEFWTLLEGGQNRAGSIRTSDHFLDEDMDESNRIVMC